MSEGGEGAERGGRALVRRAGRRHSGAAGTWRLGQIEAAAPSDDDLVRHAQAGSEDARDRLYHNHFPHVYAYLLEALKHHSDAEDACQHVFLKVFEALPSYKAGGEPFTAWLFTLVRNHAIDRLKSATRRTAAIDPHELARSRTVEEARVGVQAGHPGNSLGPAVEALPRLQRQILALLYVHDLPATEAAAILGRSPQAIRQLHRRALARLASAIAS